MESIEKCRTDLVAARKVVLAVRDPKGIHQTRVALRRMRAVASLFGSALADERLLDLRADAKHLADACGAVRDLDVFLAGLLAGASRRFADKPQAAKELCAFRFAGMRLRRGFHDAARAALRSEIFERFNARLTGLAAEPGGPVADGSERLPLVAADGGEEPAESSATTNARTFARETLRRRDRKLRARIERLAELDEPRRHALRLKVKKLRYVATFLAPLFDDKAAPDYLRAITGLQDELGRANDRCVAVKVVADIKAAAEPAHRFDWSANMLTGWLSARVRAGDDERELLSAARRFAKAPRFWRD